jgi:hypothetical protein
MLANHFTLVLFIPVISAIAGNIGLQTSSSVTSFLNLRMADKQPFSVAKLMGKYILICGAWREWRASSVRVACEWRARCVRVMRVVQVVRIASG